MKTELIEKMSEIQQWCLENNSDTFTCFCSFSGHVNAMTLSVHVDGYNHSEVTWLLHCGSNISELSEVFMKLRDLHLESLERNKPENAKALKAEQLEKLRIINKKAEEQLEMEIYKL